MKQALPLGGGFPSHAFSLKAKSVHFGLWGNRFGFELFE